LKGNVTLRELDISSNRIGVDGATALAGSLGEMKALRKLYVNNNMIGDDGAAALATSFKNMPGLVSRKRIDKIVRRSILAPLALHQSHTDTRVSLVIPPRNSAMCGYTTILSLTRVRRRLRRL
jgi:Ran GTPase-activating protein (RanGAP) involved in mRNA processing and transport